MATKRSNQTWIAPRSGGYSARSAVTGRSVRASTTSRQGATVTERTHGKPAPPAGPAAASAVRASKDSGDR